MSSKGQKSVDAELLSLKAELAAELAGALRIHDINSRLLGKLALADLLHEILNAAIDVTQADFGNIQLLDGCVLRIVVQRGFDREFLDFFREVRRDESAACGAAFAAAARVIVEDVDSDPIFEGTEARSVLLRAGIRAVQSTPLFSRSGELYGMLSTHFRSPRRPSERGLRYLDLLARQAADFIERLNAEALQHREKLTAIGKMSSAIAHELNNPVQALTNVLCLLSTHKATQGDAQKLVQLAHEQLQRVGDSLRKMLAIESRVASPVSTEIRELLEMIGTPRTQTGCCSEPSIRLQPKAIGRD